jgi:hypothetical protein
MATEGYNWMQLLSSSSTRRFGLSFRRHFVYLCFAFVLRKVAPENLKSEVGLGVESGSRVAGGTAVSRVGQEWSRFKPPQLNPATTGSSLAHFFCKILKNNSARSPVHDSAGFVYFSTISTKADKAEKSHKVGRRWFTMATKK